MGFFEWLEQRDRLEALQRPEVLWIFGDGRLEPGIRSAVAGERSVGTLLGYPECCVAFHDEGILALVEAFVEGRARQHGARSLADFIRLTESDAKVLLDTRAAEEQMIRSARALSFAQFVACPNCLTSPESPALSLNRQFGELARRVSPRFAHDILSIGRAPPG